MKVTELEVDNVYTIDKLGILFRKKDNGYIEYKYGEEPWVYSGIPYNDVIDSDFTKYEEPVDWSKVEVDTKILVRDNEEYYWKKRHFAKFENGIVYSFHNGNTSFTSDSVDEVIRWNYAKLYKETPNEK